LSSGTAREAPTYITGSPVILSNGTAGLFKKSKVKNQKLKIKKIF